MVADSVPVNNKYKYNLSDLRVLSLALFITPGRHLLLAPVSWYSLVRVPVYPDSSIPLLRLLLSSAIKKRLYRNDSPFYDVMVYLYKRSNHILNGFPKKQENTVFLRLGFGRSRQANKQFAYSNEVNITSFNMELS